MRRFPLVGLLRSGQSSKLLAFILAFSVTFYLSITNNHTNNSYSSAKVPVSARPRILCWVLTFPKHHDTLLPSINQTWGQRCDRLLFFSSVSVPEKGILGVKVDKEDTGHLVQKVQQVLRHIYRDHIRDADWFLKADDDTYVVVENLRHLLETHSPHEPIYFGHRFQKYVHQGYMSGGSGYLLSKEAMRRIVHDKNVCNEIGFGQSEEDIFIGRCLEEAGVHAGDSREPGGEERFFPLGLNPGAQAPDWWWEYSLNRHESYYSTFGRFPATFHGVSPTKMYMLEYFFYKANVCCSE